MSTDGPRAARVLIGFFEARTTIASPLEVPPSIPPALLVGRRKPSRRSSGGWSASYAIGSITREPGRRAASTPRPISTPLIAWMLITARASRASSLRSHWAWLPRPIGQPRTTASTTPPRVSPAALAASIAATMAASAAGSRV